MDEWKTMVRPLGALRGRESRRQPTMIVSVVNRALFVFRAHGLHEADFGAPAVTVCATESQDGHVRTMSSYL